MAAEVIVHVIDDDEAVRQSIEFLLRTSGVTARTYDSASAFLDVLPTVESGCIITECECPESAGSSSCGVWVRCGLEFRSLSLPVTAMYPSPWRQ